MRNLKLFFRVIPAILAVSAAAQDRPGVSPAAPAAPGLFAPAAAPRQAQGSGGLFERDNLVAWCIVPFDAKKRGPEERAEMLHRLGFLRFAYDWRDEHLPSFDAELDALARHGVLLEAVWFPARLDDHARFILDRLGRRNLRPQLWVMLEEPGADATTPEAKADQATGRLRPVVEAAAKAGCPVALYNHGGWFGEPENLIEVIEHLKRAVPVPRSSDRSEGGSSVEPPADVGLVYNLHHGHDHLDRFPALLAAMLPHLKALNLNGMVAGGDAKGMKILPIGQGDLDLGLLKSIRNSGYSGPIGILGHTDDDAEARLQDNLDGLDWLLPQLDGRPAGPRPATRTVVPGVPGPVGASESRRVGASERGSAPLTTSPSVEAVEAVNAPTLRPSDAQTLRPSDAQTLRRTDFAGTQPDDVMRRLVDEANLHGDPHRGAAVFRDARFACLSCHKVGNTGGSVGPELTAIGRDATPEQIVESILRPGLKVKEGYATVKVLTADGRTVHGVPVRETETELVLREASGAEVRLPKTEIEGRREAGTLMPDGLVDAMSPAERRDLVRFLTELGRTEGGSTQLTAQLADAVALPPSAHAPAEFPCERKPLDPERWPSWEHSVNRDRVYDYYAKEARYFRDQPVVPMLLPAYPGLDGGAIGHWGNQDEAAWSDDRWNKADLGSLQCGVFRGRTPDGNEVTVPKGVCVRLGDGGELSVCFDPATLRYAAAWKGGFVRISSVRYGFLDGFHMDGEAVEPPASETPGGKFTYQGFHRHGRRVIFAYRVGDVDWLDAPWAEDGRIVRVAGPAATHPLRDLTRGGPAQWPQTIETRGTLGAAARPGSPQGDGPYEIDTILPPFDNPWRSLLFFGGHDFFPDGSAALCTIQGDVWRVEGLDDNLEHVRWRRIASGLHHALGLVVADGQVVVQGRDQITRLRDLNGDGETDFYECVSNAYATSPAGHDFICGLERDAEGRFYTASGNQGLLRISADGRDVGVLATGFRNPDGLSLRPDGTPTVPCSEGDWTPASMICAIRPGGHYGYPGPRDGKPPDLPLVYLPRGLDNSSGGQVTVTSDRWGPLQGKLIHFSHGAGTHFLVLWDGEGMEDVGGTSRLRPGRGDPAPTPQGAVVPLPGEFASGPHRGRFNPRDGQLYVSGMRGWGTYTVADGCFQRVRYTGRPVQLPIGFSVHENGVRVTFARPLDRAVAARAKSHFAQVWNYRYSGGYGSPELSPSHRGTVGHDPLAIASAHVLDDGRTLFLEIPDLQPVNQLHLYLDVGGGPPREMFVTVHRPGPDFEGFPGYRPAGKTIAAHPMLVDLAAAAATKPNPWRKERPGAREIVLEAGKNLTYATRILNVRAGETVRLTFANPDVVPHNWVLARPGTLEKVGTLANKLVADPAAAARHYVPESDDVLVYTDIVPPGARFSVWFTAPAEKGRYPYLCTFPGHWMVMNGEMIVE